MMQREPDGALHGIRPIDAMAAVGRDAHPVAGGHGQHAVVALEAQSRAAPEEKRP